jgi:hypothetical protein
MKRSKVQQALKEFKQGIKRSFPNAIINVYPPVADEDKFIEVVLPKISHDDWDRIVTIQSDVEWEYHVTFGVIPVPKDQAAA